MKSSLLLATVLLLFGKSVQSAEFSRISPTTVRMIGIVASGDAEKLTQVSSPKTRLLRVDSAGGDTDAGMRLGRLIREKNLDVEVNGICASSCANYILPAGKRKFVRRGSVLALHGTARTSSLANIATYKELLLSAGIPAHRVDAEIPGLVEMAKKQAALEAEFAKDLGIDANYYNDFILVGAYFDKELAAKVDLKDVQVLWWPSAKRLADCYGIRDVTDQGRPGALDIEGFAIYPKRSLIIVGDKGLPPCAR